MMDVNKASATQSGNIGGAVIGIGAIAASIAVALPALLDIASGVARFAA